MLNRSALRSAFAATGAGLGAGSLLGDDTQSSQSCKQKCNRNVCLPKPPEARCQSSSACCLGQTKYSCALSHNSGTDDIRCGTEGVTCSTTVQCCLRFNCEGGQCVPMGT
jgi:hypothetical protein